MKNIIFRYFAVAAVLFSILSCSEKELLMPENQAEEVLETLKTRPSLRPDSVQVYPAFYNSVEVVFPNQQPDRAVKSVISYKKDDGTDATIEVTDFDQVIHIDGLSVKPHSFSIVYYNAEERASRSVVRTVVPYAAVTDYPYGTLEGYGELGTVFIHWQNVTGKEVEVTVNYEEGGQSKSVAKLSTKLRDTIAISDLLNIETTFKVQIKDPAKNFSSAVKELKVIPGISVENHALTTLSSTPGFGRAFLTWENPTQLSLLLKLTYTLGTETKHVEYSSADAQGNFILINLPEGITQVSARFTNTTNQNNSVTKILGVEANKGVKEAVSEQVEIGSSGGNKGIIRVKNPTSVPVTMQIKYQNQTAQEKQVEYVLQPNNSGYAYIPLEDARDNATVSVDFTDDIGTFTKAYSSAIHTIPMDSWYAQSLKSTWTATASSSRTGHVPSTDPNSAFSKFHVRNILDGHPNNGTSDGTPGSQNPPSTALGFVSNEVAWTNDYGSPVVTDSLGKNSNVAPHWIKVDTKQPRVFTSFAYTTGRDAFRPGLSYVEYSMDGVNWERATTHDDTGSPTTTFRAVTVNFDKPVVGRYIRLYITSILGSTTTVRLSEVFLKGEEFHWN